MFAERLECYGYGMGLSGLALWDFQPCCARAMFGRLSILSAADSANASNT